MVQYVRFVHLQQLLILYYNSMKKLLFATLLLLCNLMVNAQIKVTGTVYSEQKH